MTFNPEQIAWLKAKLDPSNVKTRSQSGRNLSYIEGWKAIDEANRIFGFDAWTSETTEIRCVAENQRKIGSSGKDGWGVSYIAKVRVIVSGIVREGVGSGHGIDVDLGLAHESALKEAETDARKRSLMTFGNPFGLALYDKTQSSVGVEADPSKIVIADTMCEAMQSARTQKALEDWQAKQQAEINRLDEVNKERVLNAARNLWRSLPKVAA